MRELTIRRIAPQNIRKCCIGNGLNIPIYVFPNSLIALRSNFGVGTQFIRTIYD
jgi:hypothetical protein